MEAGPTVEARHWSSVRSALELPMSSNFLQLPTTCSSSELNGLQTGVGSEKLLEVVKSENTDLRGLF